MELLPRRYSSETVKTLFGRVLPVYDFWSRLTEEKATGEALRLADIRNGERVLEVAVGTGRVFERLVRDLNPDGEDAGIDLSHGMVERARRRLRDVDSTHYSLSEGDALDLAFEDDRFDLILNNYMLDLLPESLFDDVLREFRRVLKPDGRVVITSMAFGGRWYHKLWYLLSRYFPRLLTNCRPIRLEEPLRRAGFEVKETRSVSQNTFPSRVVRAEPRT